MSEEHSGLSRRTTLKSLGAAGAVLVLGGAVPAAQQADPKPAVGAQDKQPVDVVDLASSRFMKGHS